MSGNLGDAVIRRRVLAWVEGTGERHVYVGGTTPGWLEQLQLTPDDVVYTAAARRKWLKGLLFGRRTRALVYDPGEVPLGTAHLKPELVFLVIALWSRLRGTYVVRPPRAVAHYHWATGMMHRWSCRLANVVMWRDEDSKDRMRVGRLVPDTAFNEPAGPSTDAPRDRLLLSLRGARALPSDAWFEAVTSVAAREGLRLTVASQVDEDEARSAELAERLGCELIPWGDDGDLSRERSRRLTYAESMAVVSDRLHVLLLAAQAGAVPVEVVEHPRPKVADPLRRCWSTRCLPRCGWDAGRGDRRMDHRSDLQGRVRPLRPWTAHGRCSTTKWRCCARCSVASEQLTACDCCLAGGRKNID